LSLTLTADVSDEDTSPTIHTNDNRESVGAMIDGVWHVDLETASGIWHPEAEDGIGLEVFALREVGGPPQIPGPLIRVPTGTEVVASIHNTLELPIRVTGLVDLPADTVVSREIAAGTTARFSFRADSPGTYWYQALPVTEDRRTRINQGSQMHGAIVVNDGAARADDRVFVIGLWRDPPDTTVSPPRPFRETLTINGKSWPHTERIVHTIGDSIHWRWVNTTPRPHPMHLHGYYFDVQARGSQVRDTIYDRASWRSVVTETLFRHETMSVAWQPPHHPGNWLFHCHLSFHVSPEMILTERDEHAGHEPHMAGLAMGIHVKPRSDADLPDRSRAPVHTLRMALEKTGVENGDWPPVEVRLSGADAVGGDAERTSGGPGPTMIFRQGEPADVHIVNGLDEPASIHWHGLELDSYADGVPDWSGLDTLIMHPIAPGNSFTAQLTLMRPGTFMYHSHINDIPQLFRGLYGTIIVLGSDEEYDPSADYMFLGSVKPFAATMPPRFRGVINGDTLLPDIEVEAGRPIRLRMGMIAPAAVFTAKLVRPDSSLAQWRPVAKDGGVLPAHQAVPGQAELTLFIGETADVEIVADPDDPVWLEFDFGFPRDAPTVRARVIAR
jgi:FtsP/CotA-like multicopper oxidase with cupredoxin domain